MQLNTLPWLDVPANDSRIDGFSDNDPRWFGQARLEELCRIKQPTLVHFTSPQLSDYQEARNKPRVS